jgi:prepilin peptidase CpaA
MFLDIDAVLLAWTLALTAVAGVYDFRTGLIPNRLVLVMLSVGVCGGLLLALAHGVDHLPVAALRAVFGAVVCSLIPVALYALQSLGGGDLKLLVAVGACLGPALGFEVQVYAFAFASIYAFGRAAFDGTLFRTLADSAALIAQPLVPRALRKPPSPSALRELRFAPAIFCGVLFAALTRGLAL